MAYDAAYKKEWRAKNPHKEAEYNRRYYAKNSLKEKERKARARQDRYTEIAGRSQPIVCEVCNRASTKIVFDHCHATGNFRGWLCNKCNVTLGYVEDSPELLRKLARYLEQPIGATGRSN